MPQEMTPPSMYLPSFLSTDMGPPLSPWTVDSSLVHFPQNGSNGVCIILLVTNPYIDEHITHDKEFQFQFIVTQTGEILIQKYIVVFCPVVNIFRSGV